ncbi:MAG: zonular occludens toxin domain-containing protein [Herminiimonas sp.]|nr:zonular occludens toxin domain-containing protein [Herminiimonas sp.]MDO9421062.1 zonular occludens toxin domain-containing protein [Herminiimonas sp.]
MVQALAELVARWKTHPEEARPIFVLGIPDLALPHSLLPTKSVIIGRALAPQIVPDLEAIPDGSLILIDEAQGCYPPRSSAMAPPDHVSELNTHRHRGIDMWLTTQHPKLVDHAVRALVGKHMHYRRLFGGMRAMVYEWDACSDSLAGTKNAVVSYWSYPKKVFNWYKSAEIHTKQKFKYPAWVWLPVIAFGLCIYTFPGAYDSLFGSKKAKPETKQSSSSAVTAKSSPPPSTSTVVTQSSPEPVPVQIEYVGCVASETKCTCMTSSGVTIIEPPQCRESASGFGYLIKVSMTAHAAQPSYAPASLAAPPASKETAHTPVQTLAADGFGVLGARKDGVRQPGS